MIITIPVWLMWTVGLVVGVPLVVVGGFFAVVGARIWWGLKDGLWG